MLLLPNGAVRAASEYAYPKRSRQELQESVLVASCMCRRQVSEASVGLERFGNMHPCNVGGDKQEVACAQVLFYEDVVGKHEVDRGDCRVDPLLGP
jgi:hypothetical protein